MIDENVVTNLILALDDYARKVGKDSYGLPIDPDTKNFNSEHGKEMIKIVEEILIKKASDYYDSIEDYKERDRLQEEFGNHDVADRESKFYAWLLNEKP